MLNFDEVPEFQRDVKQLKKKWRSIPIDIDKVKLVIERLYVPIKDVDLQEFREQFFSTKRATILIQAEGYEVIKMRFDCSSLGNDKKTRLIFIAICTENRVNLVELFAKNSNEREDTRRIKKYTQQ